MSKIILIYTKRMERKEEIRWLIGAILFLPTLLPVLLTVLIMTIFKANQKDIIATAIIIFFISIAFYCDFIIVVLLWLINL